jgi:hypothetical protein
LAPLRSFVLVALAALLPASAWAVTGVTPSGGSVAPRQTKKFTGLNCGFCFWSMETNNSGGDVEDDGTYVAGATGGVVDKIKITDLDNGTITTYTFSVTVTAGVSITPSSASLKPSESRDFNASGGSNTGFTWRVATNNSGATINSSGLYKAGTTGNVTDVIEAKDSLNNTRTASISVGPAITIAPSSASLAPLSGRTFTATGGSGTGYTWSFATNASGGTITTGGVYAAGANANKVDVIRVTDSLGNVKTANVTVTNEMALTPTEAELPPKGSNTLVVAGGSTPYTFAFETNASGGTFDATTKEYVAGPTGNVVDRIKVTDNAGTTRTAVFTIGPAVTASPESAIVVAGSAVSLAASGGSGEGFLWSLSTNTSGGTINASTGEYTSGMTGGGVDVVTVTDSLGNQATVSITVAAAIGPPRMASELVAKAECDVPYTYSDGAIPKVNGSGPFTFEVRVPEGGSLPEGFTINSYSGELSWTPSPAQVGKYAFELLITGPAGQDSHGVEVEVTCDGKSGGCGCGASGFAELAPLAGGLFLLAGLRRRRRRSDG